MVPDSEIMSYYSTQSSITDPGPHARLFDDLPSDLLSLVRIIQGMFVHPSCAGDYALEGLRPVGDWMGFRAVSDTLGHLLTINDQALSVPRDPVQRYGVICHGFALMLVSTLRHQGVPARKRSGFAKVGSKRLIHEVAEYWDHAEGRWALIEAVGRPETTTVQSIKADGKFITGGEAWTTTRRGTTEATQFQQEDTARGWPWILFAAWQDWGDLNKAELLPYDYDRWGTGIESISFDDSTGQTLTIEQKAAADRIAYLAAHADKNFDEIRGTYISSPHGQAIGERLRGRSQP